MEAAKLLELYKESKKEKVIPISKELAPLFGQLANLLERIAEKELPTPLVEVSQPEVQVKVEAPNVTNEVTVPELKVPSITVDNYDYTSLFIELKRSVDKLAQIVENRPQTWQVERNNRGFIEKVKGINEA